MFGLFGWQRQHSLVAVPARAFLPHGVRTTNLSPPVLSVRISSLEQTLGSSVILLRVALLRSLVVNRISLALQHLRVKLPSAVVRYHCPH